MTQEVGSGKSRRGRPIELGGALVTIVEPHRGHEVAYNRWYERDHFYAGCMIGAWTVSGARFVATRDLKALRVPASSPICPDPEGGSFLSLYWVLAGRFGDWMDWGTRQVRWLIDEDRMFTERDHVHTVMYRFRAEVPGREDGVPVELALDHRSPFVVVLVADRAAGAEASDISTWLAAQDLGAEVTAVFEPVPMPDDAPSDVPSTKAERRVTALAFVDGDVTDGWADRWAVLPEAFASAGLGELQWVAPYRATVPGTDTHTDQLWS